MIFISFSSYLSTTRTHLISRDSTHMYRIWEAILSQSQREHVNAYLFQVTTRTTLLYLMMNLIPGRNLTSAHPQFHHCLHPLLLPCQIPTLNIMIRSLLFHRMTNRLKIALQTLTWKNHSTPPIFQHHPLLTCTSVSNMIPDSIIQCEQGLVSPRRHWTSTTTPTLFGITINWVFASL